VHEAYPAFAKTTAIVIEMIKLQGLYAITDPQVIFADAEFL